MSGKGFTYMSVLVLLVVMGIALASASRSWRTVMQREREKALLFRGGRIRNAIASYYNAGKTKKGVYPSRLKDLLKDPRFPGVRRHIRKVYRDPFSESGEWGIILGKGKRIRGVYSKHAGKPLKTGNFPDEFSHFEKASQYSDWKFVFVPKKKKQQG